MLALQVHVYTEPRVKLVVDRQHTHATARAAFQELIVKYVKFIFTNKIKQKPDDIISYLLRSQRLLQQFLLKRCYLQIV